MGRLAACPASAAREFPQVGGELFDRIGFLQQGAGHRAIPPRLRGVAHEREEGIGRELMVHGREERGVVAGGALEAFDGGGDAERGGGMSSGGFGKSGRWLMPEGDGGHGFLDETFGLPREAEASRAGGSFDAEFQGMPSCLQGDAVGDHLSGDFQNPGGVEMVGARLLDFQEALEAGAEGGLDRGVGGFGGVQPEFRQGDHAGNRALVVREGGEKALGEVFRIGGVSKQCERRHHRESEPPRSIDCIKRFGHD